MTFWISAAILCLLAAFAFIWPMLRRADATLERSDGAIAIFRDQLEEVDRDVQRGLISVAESDAARMEIKRRMLAADRSRATVIEGGVAGRSVLVAVALAVPLAGGALYSQLGAPGTPSRPFAERVSEQADAKNLIELTDKLRARLEDEPQGGETRGWQLLADTYTNMGRYADAIFSYEKIVERADANSATWSQYVEVLITQENGQITKKAEAAIDKAIEMDPNNPAGSYYRALAQDQAGDTSAARQRLLERIDAETALAPWMDVFLREANRMGAQLGLEPATLPEFANAPRGPSQGDMQAASQLSEQKRQDFIRNMVSNLAERMKSEPENLQGWLQLAQAYTVLGRTADARAALENAKALTDALPQNDPRRLAVEQGLEALAN